MKYLILLMCLFMLVGCTHIKTIQFYPTGEASCEASYTSLGKSVRSPQAKACGSVFGASGTSYDELANLIPIEEILATYLSKIQLPEIPTTPQVPEKEGEAIKPPEATPEPQPEDDKEETPVIDEPTTDDIVSEYETRFHHTTTASSDGGKSLVMCPGQDIIFDSCESNGVSIPHHGRDNGRAIYWNMNKEPEGDIVCVKDGEVYKYKADKTIVYGECKMLRNN